MAEIIEIEKAKKPIGVIGALIAALTIGIGTGKFGGDMIDARKVAVADSLLTAYEATADRETLRDVAVPERELLKSPSGKIYTYVKGEAPEKITDVVTDSLTGAILATYTKRDMTVQALPAKTRRRYRYQSPYVCEINDSFEIQIRFKPDGGSWQIVRVPYTPEHSLPAGCALSLVMEVMLDVGDKTK